MSANLRNALALASTGDYATARKLLRDEPLLGIAIRILIQRGWLDAIPGDAPYFQSRSALVPGLHLAAMTGEFHAIPQHLVTRYDLQGNDSFDKTILDYLAMRGELSSIKNPVVSKLRTTLTDAYYSALLTHQEDKWPYPDSLPELNANEELNIDALLIAGREDLLPRPVREATLAKFVPTTPITVNPLVALAIKTLNTRALDWKAAIAEAPQLIPAPIGVALTKGFLVGIPDKENPVTTYLRTTSNPQALLTELANPQLLPLLEPRLLLPYYNQAKEVLEKVHTYKERTADDTSYIEAWLKELAQEKIKESMAKQNDAKRNR